MPHPKILAFSDWSTQNIDDVFKYVQSTNGPIDAILYAGDDVSKFKNGDTNYFSELAKLTTWKKVLAVVGNNDKSDSAKPVLQGENVVDLHEEPFVIEEFGFMGLEGAPWGSDPDFEQSAIHHLEKQYKKMGTKKSIVVSHSPPYGVLDLGIRYAPENKQQHHTGSTSLREFIQQNDVLLVVCGHCHSQGGHDVRFPKARAIQSSSNSLHGWWDTSRTYFHETTIANVSSHDRSGDPGKLALIDLASIPPNVQWSDTNQMIDHDSLRRLHNIGPKRDAKFKSAGIETIQDLINTKDHRQISQKVGLSEEFIYKTQINARACSEKKIIRTSEFSPPSGDLVFFDIETDLKRERVWLIGILHGGNFVQFYAKDWDREKKVLEDFLGFLDKMRGMTWIIYSCKWFDRNVICRALARHGLDPDPFSSLRHVDLCLQICKSFVFPNQSYGLKEIGRHLGYHFAHAELDGVAVATEYQEHIDKVRDLDRRILQYNKDDVYALPYIINKLESHDHDMFAR